MGHTFASVSCYSVPYVSERLDKRKGVVLLAKYSGGEEIEKYVLRPRTGIQSLAHVREMGVDGLKKTRVRSQARPKKEQKKARSQHSNLTACQLLAAC
eukprot:scaffold2824_cov142-Skeletonema_menzelii.AAC.13